MKMEVAYFAGGCFWCITPIFRIYGAKNIKTGYSGGDEQKINYKLVKAQKTGHRETICVEYDSEVVSYEKLLQLFIANIDPFDATGQYIDKGHSYTTAIYYQNEKEKQLAQQAIKQLEEQTDKKCCIAIESFKFFVEAEEEHQNFDLNHPDLLEKELIESGRKKAHEK